MKQIWLGLVMCITVISCNGGNGGGYSYTTPNGQTIDYSHNELAELFINSLNSNAQFEVQIVKSSTEQYNYVLVYDVNLQSYTAINIGGFDPRTHNATDFYNNTTLYTDIEKVPGYTEKTRKYLHHGYHEVADCQHCIYRTRHIDESGFYWVKNEIPDRYFDNDTGLEFEKTKANPKDLAKLAALQEEILLNKKAKSLAYSLGLSLERSKEVTRLTHYWETNSLKAMSNQEADEFSQELLGFSITEGKKAADDFVNGELRTMEELLEKAAEQNELTPEHARALMTKVFNF